MRRLAMAMLFVVVGASAESKEICYRTGRKSSVLRVRDACSKRETAVSLRPPTKAWIDANGKIAGDLGLTEGMLILNIDSRAYKLTVDLASGQISRPAAGYLDWMSIFEQPRCQGTQWPIASPRNTVLPEAMVSDEFPGKVFLPPGPDAVSVSMTGLSYWDSDFDFCVDVPGGFEVPVSEFEVHDYTAVEPFHVGYVE